MKKAGSVQSSLPVLHLMDVISVLTTVSNSGSEKSGESKFPWMKSLYALCAIILVSAKSKPPLIIPPTTGTAFPKLMTPLFSEHT